MRLETACKPDPKCSLCAAKHRRYIETFFKPRRVHFYHHLGGAEFKDCEEQTYERIPFGAFR